MAGRFASQTSVSVGKSRAEIETILKKYGASRFGYMSEDKRAVIAFVCRDRQIRFIVPLPSVNDLEFKYTPGRRKMRSGDSRAQAWEQACRSRWRALLLAIKAKLESVDVGIAEFDQEFFGYIVNPATGQTLHEDLREDIAARYIGQESQPLALPGPKT